MPIGAALGAAAITAGGTIAASQTNANSQKAALTLQQQQDAEAVRERNQANAAAAYQWQVEQAQLAPYRAARAAVLSKFGINVNQPTVKPPPGFGTPEGIQVPTNLPPPGSGVSIPGANPMLLGAPAVGSAALAAYRLAHQPQQTNPFAGTVIDPSQLNNFNPYTQSQPGQIPSGTVPGSSFVPDPSLQNLDQGGGGLMNVPIDYTGEGD